MNIENKSLDEIRLRYAETALGEEVSIETNWVTLTIVRYSASIGLVMHDIKSKNKIGYASQSDSHLSIKVEEEYRWKDERYGTMLLDIAKAVWMISYYDWSSRLDRIYLLVKNWYVPTHASWHWEDKNIITTDEESWLRNKLTSMHLEWFPTDEYKKTFVENASYI